MSAVTTFIFDLSDVLVGGMGDVTATFAARLGLTHEKAYELVYGQWLVELCCGEITEEEYLARILRCAARDCPGLTPDEMKASIREGFHHPIPGMDKLVVHLARRYQVVLLSDHVREWVDYIKDLYPFLGVFPHRFFSFDMGKSKRQGTAFPHLLASVHRPPASCLLIDDNPTNIERARQYGIPGIVFQNLDQLLMSLPAYGVKLSPAEIQGIRANGVPVG